MKLRRKRRSTRRSGGSLSRPIRLSARPSGSAPVGVARQGKSVRVGSASPRAPDLLAPQPACPKPAPNVVMTVSACKVQMARPSASRAAGCAFILRPPAKRPSSVRCAKTSPTAPSARPASTSAAATTVWATRSRSRPEPRRAPPPAMTLRRKPRGTSSGHGPNDEGGVVVRALGKLHERASEAIALTTLPGAIAPGRARSSPWSADPSCVAALPQERQHLRLPSVLDDHS
jgi:hypothetical protein